MKHAATLILVAALVACNDEQIQQTGTLSSAVDRTEAKAAEMPKRFLVTRVDVIRDRIAYGSERGVYVITDTQTGREFVGVSGIGISELGSHMAGKTKVGDER